MRTGASKRREIVLAGLIAAAAIACGEAAMSGAGEAMRDAGGALKDAGGLLADAGGTLSDGGRSMMEMGAHMLMDAGETLSDAGDALKDAGGSLGDAGSTVQDASSHMMADSAQAQSTCGACTAGDRQMIVTADQDTQQLEGGTVEGTGWAMHAATSFFPLLVGGGTCTTEFESRLYAAELANGPFVLTDLYATSGTTQLFVVADADECYEPYSFGATILFTCDATNAGIPSHERLRQPTSSRTLFPAPASLSGARILVAAGEKLCAITGDTAPVAESTTAAVGTKLVWSGFTPYD